MRVVSLLPAATEILASLGLLDRLVAVSHDCDHPPEIARKPRITHCEIHDAGLPSAEVDRWVRETLEERGTLYTIDEALLRRLEPDLVLTQQLCDVCAPAYGSVALLAAALPKPPRVLNLEPSSLADVLENIRTVARAVGAPERGEAVVAGLEQRIRAVRERAERPERRPGVVVVEWLEPLFGSGHWGPELVRLAGGTELLGREGRDSTSISWESLVASDPEVLVFACCGNPVERTLAELPALRARPGWDELAAVRNGRVFVADGGAYFSRPGPRLVDSLELLAGVLHPDLFPAWAPERQPRERVTRVDARAPA